MNDWEAWLTEATSGASARQIASAIDGSNASVSRWIREENIPAEAAISIARAFKADPVEALVAAGYLTPGDLYDIKQNRSLRQASNMQILNELLRREILRTEAETGTMDVIFPEDQQ